MQNRKGFTLIELLIVVVIIGILAAIAIPKFANTKEKAVVASMKSDLRNLVTSQEAFFSDNQDYAGSIGATQTNGTGGAGVVAFGPSANNTITINYTDAAGWSALFERNRPRDLLMKTTLAGPHRDDCDLTVSKRPAREFASEGQQRSLAIALRVAEVEYLHARTGAQPLLLADDVLGELDPERRRRFWDALGSDRQVIATGTTLPDASLGAWQIFHVTAGSFSASMSFTIRSIGRMCWSHMPVWNTFPMPLYAFQK